MNDIEVTSDRMKLPPVGFYCPLIRDRHGIHVNKPFTGDNFVDLLKKYGFFIIIGRMAPIFLLLIKRPKDLSNRKDSGKILNLFCYIL
ncbi:hypothetical protein [Bacillus sp. GB_SG_008]|uniref:hypothetical protein n=1 Tax=Bacillus sp. GB_SG_008 TaxID=3454627 RepID=UPI003F866FE6